MKAWIFPVVLLVALAMAISPVFAQTVQPLAPQCGGYSGVLEGLAARYGESVVWSGRRPDGSLVVITAAESGSWTLLLVLGSEACIATFGQNAASRPAQPAGEEI